MGQVTGGAPYPGQANARLAGRAGIGQGRA